MNTENEFNVEPKPFTLPWGSYSEKPEIQSQWESAVAAELSGIDTIRSDFRDIPRRFDSLPPHLAHLAGTTWQNIISNDIRPRVENKMTKEWLLIDSGAMLTVYPRSRYPGAQMDQHQSIRAINKTKINTYGTTVIQIRIGRKTYNHVATIADVDQPVLGWDFCKKFKLSLVWNRFGDLEIWDQKAMIRAPLQMCSNGDWPSLSGCALVQNVEPQFTIPQVAALHDLFATEIQEKSPKSFQQWSSEQKQKTNIETDLKAIPAEYAALLAKYPSILKCDFTTTSVKHGITHRIETGNNRPCQAKCRPLMPGSPKALQAEKDWKELAKLGIIVPVNPNNINVWTSALHLATKPDGTYRICGDFRALNDRTLLDGFPLPNIRNFMGQIKGSSIFSKVDLVKAFHQIPLDPESQDKTTIVSPWGAWKFARLPMGLKNSAQSFQRLMTHVLGDIPGLFIYLDDVLVYSKDETSHKKTLETMFKRLHEAGLAISLKKCVFGVESLDFLGYKVDKNGITPLEKS